MSGPFLIACEGDDILIMIKCHQWSMNNGILWSRKCLENSGLTRK